MRANGAGDEEGISLIGRDCDMFEEGVAAGRKPVAADKGAAAQRIVGRGIRISFDLGEGRDDHVGDFSGEIWRTGL